MKLALSLSKPRISSIRSSEIISISLMFLIFRSRKNTRR